MGAVLTVGVKEFLGCPNSGGKDMTFYDFKYNN